MKVKVLHHDKLICEIIPAVPGYNNNKREGRVRGEGEGGEEEKNHNRKFKLKRDFCWCGFALHNNISTIQKKKKL